MSTDVMTKNRPVRMQSSAGRVSPAQTEAWHMLPVEQAVERQKSDVAQGLTQAEAARRLVQFGPNALAQAHQRSTLSIFVAQFQSLIVALLVAAGCVVGRLLMSSGMPLVCVFCDCFH